MFPLVILAYIPWYDILPKFRDNPVATSLWLGLYAVCAIGIWISPTLYSWLFDVPERDIDRTIDEVVVVIGGGYGYGAAVADDFQRYMYNTAIVDTRNTDGGEFIPESRRTKKYREAQRHHRMRALAKQRQRAIARGEEIDERRYRLNDVEPYHYVYKCDPADKKALEQTRQQIEEDFGHPTILVFAYTPILEEAGKLYQCFQNSLSVFGPAIKEAQNGGCFATVCSAVGHIQPGPLHLKTYANECRKIYNEHQRLKHEVRKVEKLDLVKCILLELGCVDERMITVHRDYVKQLKLIRRRVERRGMFIPNPSSREETDALMSLHRRRLDGLLARNVPDKRIAELIHEAIRKGRDAHMEEPAISLFWTWITVLPYSWAKWLYGIVGINETMKGLTTCEYMEGEEGLYIGLETDLQIEVEKKRELRLELTANDGTMIQLLSSQDEEQAIVEDSVRKKTKRNRERKLARKALKAIRQVDPGVIEQEQKENINCKDEADGQGGASLQVGSQGEKNDAGKDGKERHMVEAN